MKWLKDNWTLIAMGVLALFLFKQCNKEPEIIEVPVKIEVPVPVIEKQFDTVYYPVPVPVKGGKRPIDSTYIKKWEALKNDSIAREKLFRKAIEINEYKEKVEDDSITINLGLKVRGELLNYNIDYKTKPRTISIDTTIRVAIPKKAKIFLGGKVILPTVINSFPSIAPGAVFIPKKNKSAFTINYDILNKKVMVGYYFKL